ncbi:MAG: hypothetical protein ABIS86_12165 [Streptosporangiaceae bacterium]
MSGSTCWTRRASSGSLLLAAKVTAYSAVVTVISLVSCLTSFFICQVILGSQHAGVSITDPFILRALFGAIGYLILIGAIAVALGAILRRTAGAVTLLFATLLVLPGLLMLLPSPWDLTISKYMPSSAGTAMAAVVHFPTLLSPTVGLLVLCGYTAATLLTAAFVLIRRDA